MQGERKVFLFLPPSLPSFSCFQPRWLLFRHCAVRHVSRHRTAAQMASRSGVDATAEVRHSQACAGQCGLTGLGFFPLVVSCFSAFLLSFFSFSEFFWNSFFFSL